MKGMEQTHNDGGKEERLQRWMRVASGCKYGHLKGDRQRDRQREDLVCVYYKRKDVFYFIYLFIFFFLQRDKQIDRPTNP